MVALLTRADDPQSRLARMVQSRRPEWNVMVHSSPSPFFHVVLERPALPLLDPTAVSLTSLRRTVDRLRVLGETPVVLGTVDDRVNCTVVDVGGDWTPLDEAFDALAWRRRPCED